MNKFWFAGLLIIFLFAAILLQSQNANLQSDLALANTENADSLQTADNLNGTVASLERQISDLEASLTPISVSMNDSSTEIAQLNANAELLAPTLTAYPQLLDEQTINSEAMRLAIESRMLLDELGGDTERAALLAIRSLKLEHSPFAEAVLLETLPQVPTIRLFEGHSHIVHAVAFSHDGRYALSGSSDNTVRLWDIATGENLLMMEGHFNQITSLAFSPDDRFAVSGSWDWTIRLWDLETGETVRIFEDSSDANGGIEGVAISPDGRFLLAVGNGLMRLWDIETGEMLRVFEGHEGTVWSVVFTPDGRSALSAGSDGTVRLWDVETGEMLRVFEGNGSSVLDVAVTPDAVYVLGALWDGTMHLWNMNTGQTLRLFEGHTALVRGVAISPDGLYALSASWDNTIRLWNLETGENIHIFEGMGFQPQTVAFSPDGTQALSGSWDGYVRLFDLSNLDNPSVAEPQVLMEFSWWVEEIAFSADARYAYAVGSIGSLQVWDFQENAIAYTLAAPEQEGYSLFSEVQFFADDRRILSIHNVEDDTFIEIWDRRDRELIETIDEASISRVFISAAAISPDNRIAAFGDNNGFITFWDLENSQLLFSQDNQAIDGPDPFGPDWSPSNAAGIAALAFSPDGQVIAAGLNNGAIELWNIESRELIHSLTGHYDALRDLAFSPDGQILVSASLDDTLRVWDVETGELLRVLEGHTAPVISLAISPDGSKILSASTDKTLRLWDLATGETLGVLSAHTDLVSAVAFSPDGTQALSGSWDGNVILWDLAPYEDLVAFACSRLFRDLTSFERANYDIEDDSPSCP